MKSVKVVFLWHMHQPYYVDPLTQKALMPWVRLHAVKGYLDMIDVAMKYPEVKLNFNVTPVLLLQLEEFAEGRVEDVWEQLARKRAEDLDEGEKQQLLEHFFKVNWEHLIFPFPRYKELLDLRGRTYDLATIQESIRMFDEGDFRDLQVWHNLAWCGFSAEKRYPEIKAMKQKGRGFTEEEKNRLLDIHAEVVSEVVGYYREAQDSGQVEVTTTPFFHPIMPLVYNTQFAERCMPGRDLPAQFSAPEDVKAHLELAQECYQKFFGRKARGLWPSEGSVAPELIPLMKEAGFEYFCTDEEVLFKSLKQDQAWVGREADHLELFQPWRCEWGGEGVKAVFRERPLSDFVGFNAAKQETEKAVGHMIHHLEHLADVVPHDNGVVCVVLDGENAWEAFSDGGEAFLNGLYEKVRDSPKLHPVRLGDVFDENQEKHTLTNLHTGSWINGDFDIWIGEGEENQGWEWIGKTRAFLTQYELENSVDEEVSKRAWRELYAAEGSDWFWWYGPDFQTDCDFLFDSLFRNHLRNVYILLGEEPPAYLEVPIRQRGRMAGYSIPSGLISPDVDGDAIGYYDWLGAGKLDLRHSGGAMYQSDRMVEGLWFGFNEERFFIRLDLGKGEYPENVHVVFHQPESARVVLSRVCDKENQVALLYQGRLERSGDGVHFYSKKEAVQCALLGENGGHLLLSVPHESLGWGGVESLVEMQVEVFENGLIREVYPLNGVIEFSAPSSEFTMQNWFV